MLSARSRPFCLGLNVSNGVYEFLFPVSIYFLDALRISGTLCRTPSIPFVIYRNVPQTPGIIVNNYTTIVQLDQITSATFQHIVSA